MDYGDLLTKGFNLVWKNRMMWLLGLLAALGAGSASTGGGGSASFQGDLQEMIEVMADPTSTEVPEIPAAFKGFFDLIELFSVDPGAAWEQVASGYLPMVLIGLLLGILFFVVRTAAMAGLIKSAVFLDDVTDEEFISEKTGGAYWREGLGFFGRLFGLALVGFLFTLISLTITFGSIGAVVGASVASGAPSPAAILLPLCLLTCLFLPLLLLWQLVQPFAFRGIVLEELGVFKSIGHGWRILRNNAGEIIVMGIIFTVLGMIWTTVIGFFLSIFGFLFGGEVLFEFFRTGILTARQGMILAVGSLIATILTALLMSIFRAWQSTVFTLGYKNFWRPKINNQ